MSTAPARILAGLALLAFFAPTANATLYVIDSQTRTLSASASAWSYDESDSDSDNDSAPGTGPFSVGIGASATIASAQSSGAAGQNSEFQPMAILAAGNVGMYADSYDFDAESDCGMNSNFSVDFTPASNLTYTLVGYVEAFDDGGSYVSLSSGPSGELHYADGFGGSFPFSWSGVLNAGETYTLAANTSGSAYGFGFSSGYASGAFDFALTITGATSVPSLLASDEFRVAPNPFRGETTIALGNAAESAVAVSIFDVQGRLVRQWPAATGATFDWDGRNDAGRRAPAGVYFVRVDGASDSPVRKVTRLR